MLWHGHTRRTSEYGAETTCFFLTNTSVIRCHRQILEAREKITDAIADFRADVMTLQQNLEIRDVLVPLENIENRISSELEGVLLASLKVSQQRIAQVESVGQLKKLLDDGLSEKSKELTNKLGSIRWEISAPSTMHAVAGETPIENVRAISNLLCQTMFDSNNNP